jgi:serine/threonine protein kinase
VWWTPTLKAAAVVWIALVLRFAHGLGPLHTDLNPANIFFDGGVWIQIVDFHQMRRDGDFSGGEMIAAVGYFSICAAPV